METSILQRENELAGMEIELCSLVSELEAETGELARLEEQRQSIVHESVDKGRNWFRRRRFSKADRLIETQKYAVESLRVEVEKARYQVNDAKKELEASKQAGADELRAYVEQRKQETRENVIQSLPDRLKKICNLYFEICLEVGELQFLSSEPSGTGHGTTITIGEVGQFFESLGSALNASFQERNLIPFASPWSHYVIGVRSYYPVSELGQSPIDVCRERVARQEKQFTEEFYSRTK